MSTSASGRPFVPWDEVKKLVWDMTKQTTENERAVCQKYIQPFEMGYVRYDLVDNPLQAVQGVFNNRPIFKSNVGALRTSLITEVVEDIDKVIPALVRPEWLSVTPSTVFDPSKIPLLITWAEGKGPGPNDNFNLTGGRHRKKGGAGARDECEGKAEAIGKRIKKVESALEEKRKEVEPTQGSSSGKGKKGKGKGSKKTLEELIAEKEALAKDKEMWEARALRVGQFILVLYHWGAWFMVHDMIYL